MLHWSGELEIVVCLLCLTFTSEYLKIKSNKTRNIVDSTHQEFYTGMLHRSLLRPKSPLRAQRQETFYQTQQTTSSRQNQQWPECDRSLRYVNLIKYSQENSLIGPHPALLYSRLQTLPCRLLSPTTPLILSTNKCRPDAQRLLFVLA